MYLLIEGRGSPHTLPRFFERENAMETLSKLDWLLNVDSQEVYYMPVKEAEIAKLGVINMDDELRVLTVNQDGFDSITDVLLNKMNFPEIGDELTQDYFSMRCVEASGYGTPSLSNKAYDLIYEYLADSGFTISDMLKQMHRILITWHEDTPVDILFNADKYEYDNPEDTRTDEELLEEAMDIVFNDDFKTFYDSYDAYGDTVILYSAS